MAHRYGVMRHRVLGLEAVLPDGTVYSDMTRVVKNTACLLYTSDAADERSSVDLGGRRIINKKKQKKKK